MNPNRKKSGGKGQGGGGSRKGKRLSNKSLADTLELEEDDDEMMGQGSHLSSETKLLLLKFKKSCPTSKDPFSADHEAIIDKLSSVAEKMNVESLAGHNRGKSTKANLVEAALLLECSAKVYCKRVLNTKRLLSELVDLATTGKEAPQKEASDEEKEEDIDSDEKTNRNAPKRLNSAEVEATDNFPAVLPTVVDCCTIAELEVSSGEEPGEAVMEDNTEDQSAQPSLVSAGDESNDCRVIEVITIEDNSEEDDIRTSAQPELPVQTDSQTEVNSPSQPANERENLPPPCKRLKKDYGSPPHLVSCFDEVYGEEGGENPPELRPEPNNPQDTLRRKIPREKPKKIGEKLLTEKSKEDELLDPKRRESDAVAPPVDIAAMTQAFPVEEEVVVKIEKDEFNLEETVPAEAGSSCAPEDSHYSPEDLSEIQRLICELHLLPFNSELTHEELMKKSEEIINNFVKRLEIIYKGRNVPIRRLMAQATSQVCAQITESCSRLIESTDTGVPDLPRLHELFAEQVKDQLAHSAEDPELTIMERTQERNKKESDLRICRMLEVIRKQIVPKYKNIPLIEENTPEFYRRVKSFENKMKRVLAEETEDFDIRKYEMDILDVACEEGQDVEETTTLNPPDLSVTPTYSPILSNPSAPCIEYNFSGLPSPCSSSASSQGGKWVPLSRMFSNMKTLDHHEAARVFYAVLALLSFQNLDIDYDRHFSSESAAVAESDQGSKFPRGYKILKSKCPDADREEIYVAAMSSKSRTELFAELQMKHQESEEQEARNRGASADKTVSTSVSSRVSSSSIPSLTRNRRQSKLSSVSQPLRIDVQDAARVDRLPTSNDLVRQPESTSEAEASCFSKQSFITVKPSAAVSCNSDQGKRISRKRTSTVTSCEASPSKLLRCSPPLSVIEEEEP